MVKQEQREVVAENEEPENRDEQGAKRVKLEDEVPLDTLHEKVSKQIEYYFSDVNVIKDKFLQEEFKKQEGWVQLATLLKFARLKELTNDEAVVAKALKESNSDVIEFDESQKQVRRKNPMPDPENFQKQLDLRTVHISGFPTDYTFENLRKFCSQFGVVESLAMRRHFKTRFFKGCIHVVFKDEADVKKVLDADVLKCKDRELRTESMEAYHKRKEEHKKKKIEKRKQRKK